MVDARFSVRASHETPLRRLHGRVTGQDRARERPRGEEQPAIALEVKLLVSRAFVRRHERLLPGQQIRVVNRLMKIIPKIHDPASAAECLRDAHRRMLGTQCLFTHIQNVAKGRRLGKAEGPETALFPMSACNKACRGADWWYNEFVSNEATGGSKPLKMVACGRCKAKTFISGHLAPFATEECKKCGHPVMLPVMLHNFELRTVIASGGMGTVYTAQDTKLQREVALKMMKREMAVDPLIMEGFYREAR